MEHLKSALDMINFILVLTKVVGMGDLKSALDMINFILVDIFGS